MAEYGSLSFAEQIEFFRSKIDLPTERWDDIWESAHDKAFIVAGAMEADLIADLKTAVAKAIEDGTTLETFRSDFEDLVAKNGWTGWTGEGTEAGVAWRTRVIYETNLRTSYAAGRYAQLQAIKGERPYWRYRHNDTVLRPREQHLAWDGLVLPADDPWWSTHYPPGGWGCRCYVESLAERDLEREGKSAPDPSPEVTFDPKTGAPLGIDKGWGYAPGATTADQLNAMLEAKAKGLETTDPALSKQWLESLTKGLRTAALLDLVSRLIDEAL